MKRVTKDDFYFKSESSKSENVLLMYANALAGHFDRKKTLGEIMDVLAKDGVDLLTVKLFCKIDTNKEVSFTSDEEPELEHCYIDCTLLEILRLIFNKNIIFDCTNEYNEFSDMLSVLIQYGEYDKKTFSYQGSMGIRDSIQSVKLSYCNGISYSASDVFDFISHLHITA